MMQLNESHATGKMSSQFRRIKDSYKPVLHTQLSWDLEAWSTRTSSVVYFKILLERSLKALHFKGQRHLKNGLRSTCSKSVSCSRFVPSRLHRGLPKTHIKHPHRGFPKAHIKNPHTGLQTVVYLLD